ncbi:MAG: hypothetical protein HC869_08625 [Rhodospirillales bacterium]|nr:hypothetical protein [Rhodospirillales bacterium]
MSQTRLPFCSPYRLFLAVAGTPDTAAEGIHDAYSRFVWRSMGIHHMLLVSALTIIWPVLFVIMALIFTRKIGPVVRNATGKSIRRQLWEQATLATLHSIPPDKYYVFELFRDERRAHANDYILRYELKGGFHNLMHRRAKSTPDERVTKTELTDKLVFSRRCRAAGVDAPVVLAYLHRNADSKKWELHQEESEEVGLPKANIFLKPAKGKGGRGCERWVFADNRYHGPAGQVADENELLRHIAGLAEGRGRYLIQECLENHPELRDIGGSLTSLRITSCKNERAQFEVTNATLKLSFTPGKSVDNFHQGGGVAKVDVRSGVVGPASDSWKDRPCVWHVLHPANGARIAGRVLPCWQATVALVERAHRLFPDQIMLGFDVAITARGPALIEGNVQSGCDMIQRTHDDPVGRQRLGQLLAFHAASAIRLPLPRKAMTWYGPGHYFRPR